MRLTTFILFAAFMQVSAAGLAQRLTLVQKNVTLKQVFTEVNKQTGYSIVWSVSQVRGNVQVDVDFKDTPLLEALDKCLEATNLTYTIENKTVVIREKEPTLVDKIKKALNIAVTVSGKVLDETGQPMAGVTVKEKGTANGVVTDAKGLFSLSVADDKAVLVFSFVGFEGQELVVKDIANGALITMKAATNNLKEVVVSKGYYSVKQELNTGNVSIITGEDIAKQPVSDPILALEGRVPGLYIYQSSGVPGATFTVQLRGRNSIANGTDPLYIIDGIPFGSNTLTNNYFGGGAGTFESPFNALTPSDIESIEILKDADATAIYGSRAANGVILINTKRGKAGKTDFDFNVNTGAGTVTHLMDLLNTQQYLQMRHEAFKNDGESPGTSNADYDLLKWDTTRYTDWQKIFLGGTARFTNIQGSISGGDSNNKFLITGVYSKQSTVFPGDFADQKGSVHVNFNHLSRNGKFKVDFTGSYVYNNRNLPQASPANFVALAPDAPPLYDANGNLNWEDDTFNNPLAAFLKQDKSVTNNLITNLNLNYELLAGLQIKSIFGYNNITVNEYLKTPLSSYGPSYSSQSELRTVQFGNNNTNTWNAEPQISYTKKFSKGELNILLGSTFSETIRNSLAQSASNFASDALLANVAAATTITVLGNTYTQYKYNAIFGRLAYNWEDKYLVNFTARRDGSSNFGPGRQFGDFGAVGVGWLFSKEKFVQNALPFVSFGKLRGSYGTTGNDQIASYGYLSTYTPYTYSYLGLAGLTPSSLANPDYSWEVVKKFEAGIELGFLNNRILFTVDYYRNRTGNQLVGFSLPTVTGFSSIIANLPAVIQNTGLEFGTETTNIKTAKFTWSTSFNLTIPKNKLISYPDLANSNYANNYIIGQSLFIQKLYHFTGVDSATGLIQFTTNNGSTTINPTYPDDLQAVKKIAQDFFGGVQNSFRYKNLQLDLFIQFVKQTGYNYQQSFGLPGAFGDIANQPTLVLRRWQNPGDRTNIQKFSQDYGSDASTAYSNASYYSDNIITDASFIRLKNVSLSYTMPSTWLKTTGLKRGTIYFQAQNLFTVTRFLGYDPETQGTFGVPSIKMISVGLQLGI